MGGGGSQDAQRWPAWHFAAGRATAQNQAAAACVGKRSRIRLCTMRLGWPHCTPSSGAATTVKAATLLRIQLSDPLRAHACSQHRGAHAQVGGITIVGFDVSSGSAMEPAFLLSLPALVTWRTGRAAPPLGCCPRIAPGLMASG